MQDEAESLPTIWAAVCILQLVALVLGVPFVLGYYMLHFTLRRSLGSAFFVALVYAMPVMSAGLGFSTPASSHVETTLEVTECRIVPEEASASEVPAEKEATETPGK